MELTATIKALKHLKDKSEIVIFTDSKYVVDGINNWIFKWKQNNWKTTNKKEVKNKDLWSLIMNSYKPEDLSIDFKRTTAIEVLLDTRLDVDISH